MWRKISILLLFVYITTISCDPLPKDNDIIVTPVDPDMEKFKFPKALCVPCKVIVKLASLGTTNPIGKGVSMGLCSFALPGYGKHGCGPLIEVGSFFLKRVKPSAVCQKIKLCKSKAETEESMMKLHPVLSETLNILGESSRNLGSSANNTEVHNFFNEFVRDLNLEFNKEFTHDQVMDFIDDLSGRFMDAAKHLIDNKDKLVD